MAQRLKNVHKILIPVRTKTNTIKDKIKQLKEITDDTGIIEKNSIQETQCPKCLQLTTNPNHKCYENGYWSCTICGLNLSKNEKMSKWGHMWVSTIGRSKVHFKFQNTFICYNCACKVTRELKEYNTTNKSNR